MTTLQILALKTQKYEYLDNKKLFFSLIEKVTNHKLTVILQKNWFLAEVPFINDIASSCA